MSQDLRAIVYIDGLNLYHGIKELKRHDGTKAFNMHQLKWLDIEKLAEKLLKLAEARQYVLTTQSLVVVKYFTARVTGYNKSNNYSSKSKSRQNHYILALQGYCLKMELIEGRFKNKDIKCLKCDTYSVHPTEKETDVNIASHIIGDLYEDKFDVAYLISGDSDLVKPMKMVVGKGKTMIVAFPPERATDQIKATATSYLKITKEILESCVLPNPLKVGSKTFERPEEWKGKELKPKKRDKKIKKMYQCILRCIKNLRNK